MEESQIKQMLFMDSLPSLSQLIQTAGINIPADCLKKITSFIHSKDSMWKLYAVTLIAYSPQATEIPHEAIIQILQCANGIISSKEPNTVSDYIVVLSLSKLCKRICDVEDKNYTDKGRIITPLVNTIDALLKKYGDGSPYMNEAVIWLIRNCLRVIPQHLQSHIMKIEKYVKHIVSKGTSKVEACLLFSELYLTGKISHKFEVGFNNMLSNIESLINGSETSLQIISDCLSYDKLRLLYSMLENMLASSSKHKVMVLMPKIFGNCLNSIERLSGEGNKVICSLSVQYSLSLIIKLIELYSDEASIHMQLILNCIRESIALHKYTPIIISAYKALASAITHYGFAFKELTENALFSDAFTNQLLFNSLKEVIISKDNTVDRQTNKNVKSKDPLLDQQRIGVLIDGKIIT
jgi:hypothetical protein